MKEFEIILGSLATTTPGILATLVKVEGSSYRRVGARLWWTPGGIQLGSISGGCLEEDLALRARRVFEHGTSETAIYDTTSENDLVWGVGLGCHGIVRVILEKIIYPRESLLAVQTAWSRREPILLLTRFGGSRASQDGLLAAVTRDGTVNADRDDFSFDFDLARLCFSERRSHHDEQLGAQAGSGVLYEFLPPPLSLCIWGAGNDAQPLARMAKEMGWRVTVSDPRPAFATQERFPSADVVSVATEPDLDRTRFDPWQVAVIMSHHYRFDVPALRILLPLELTYLGLLGPKKRSDKILEDLAAEGFLPTPGMRERLRAPVGLDIGANSPEQVALAIVAEIEAVVNQRDGRPLKERLLPIHG